MSVSVTLSIVIISLIPYKLNAISHIINFIATYKILIINAPTFTLFKPVSTSRNCESSLHNSISFFFIPYQLAFTAVLCNLKHVTHVMFVDFCWCQMWYLEKCHIELLGKVKLMNVVERKPSWDRSRWRHQVETFSALLAICVGNSPVYVNFPHNGQWRGALMFSLICARINSWVNNRKAGDLRRHRGHYDVIVICIYQRHVYEQWLPFVCLRNDDVIHLKYIYFSYLFLRQ